jgi:hypothetical protein
MRILAADLLGPQGVGVAVAVTLACCGLDLCDQLAHAPLYFLGFELGPAGQRRQADLVLCDVLTVFELFAATFGAVEGGAIDPDALERLSVGERPG